MMNSDIKQDWITALTGGRYKQGRSRLKGVPYGSHERTEHCCLGVLCELYYEDHRDAGAKWTVSKDGFVEYSITDVAGNADVCSPPKHVKLWAQIIDDDIDTLIDLNDSRDYDFEDIANWIKEHL